MKGKISASIMCADLLNLEKQLRELEKARVDYVHIDVMDAHFVPNLTFGVDTVNAIAENTNIPLDIHLLVEHPETIVRRLNIVNGTIVTVHVECSDTISGIAKHVRNAGAKFGLALNPETPVESVREYLAYLDVILLMLTPPGFSGLKIASGVMDKVAKLRSFLQREHANPEIEVDGGVGLEHAEYTSRLGANIFVGGTTSIFKRGELLSTTVAALRSRVADSSE